MTMAAFLIGERLWLVPAVSILAVTSLVLWWAYRSSTAVGPVRLIAAVLKATAFAVLVACLVEPLWSGLHARPGANIFVLLADNSQSMQIHEPGEKATRGDRLRSLLKLPKEKTPEAWQVRLAQDFDVRRHVVDSRLSHVDSFADLKFNGSGSSIGTALSTIRERFQGRPLGGVLLFTDGNATDMAVDRLDLKGLPPIYPVIIGSEQALKDIAIGSVSVSQSSFEDAPVSIQADVTCRGYQDAEIVARLLDEQGQLVKEETLAVGDEQTPLAVRFQFRPKKPGVSFYRLRVGEKTELGSNELAEPSPEATLANNARLLKIDRGAGRHRILYVSGRPNWEFKFLRRAIQKDDQIELVGLIRVANREPKFDWRGRADESSNPLFRGFKKQGDEETERYDQPVLVRLNTKSASELRDGFPKAEEDLFRYTALILDDVEAKFFNHDQMALLQRFVSERGGGLLMLGGRESFRNGGYHRTAIGDMLPVYLDRPEPKPPNARYRLTLTRTGWLRPWVRLRNNEADERHRLDQMPAFHTLNPVRSVKPAAMVLANVTDSSGKTQPALVAQRFGRGRCAALTIGDLWRWQLKRQDDADDLSKAWRQMLRWLASDVPDRIDVQLQKRPDLSDAAVQLKVRARNADFKPLENATVRIVVQSPADRDDRPDRDNSDQGESETTDRGRIELDAEPSLKEPGLYETFYVPRHAGAYRATITVTDNNGKEIGTNETGWTSDPAAAEFRSIAPNRELMQLIATTTGGEIIDADSLNDFVRGLSTRSMPIMEQWTLPLWDQTWVFLIAIGCLIGEWGLRRWKGLP